MAPPECPFRNITCTPLCPVAIGNKCSVKIIAESCQNSKSSLDYIHNRMCDVVAIMKSRM
jgi:hypothetical protein